MDFTDKVVIVTGASSGIGAATTVLFAKYSAKVVVTGRNEANLKKVAKLVEAAKGIKPLIIKADLTHDEEVKKIVDGTIKHFGRIDVLVNNAGAGVMAGILEGVEHLDSMVSLNLRSVYLLTSLAAPHLIKSKGNIINVSSVAGMKPVAQFMPYCISKAGLDMFTKCVALGLAEHGVRVNSVNPGPTESEFHNRLGLGKEAADAMMKSREQHSPLKKIATSEDVAEVILFLASCKASSVTGSIYVIDTGFVLA